MTALTFKKETASAIYANLFAEMPGRELWRQLLSAPEIVGTRNASETTVRRLGALTTALYGGPGSIDPSTDYQNPDDVTITINFDRVARTLIELDETEHERTVQGFEGSKSAMGEEGARSVIDFVTTDILSLASTGATDGGDNATLTPDVFIEAGQFLDGNNVPKTGRVAFVDAAKIWDSFDGSKKIAIGDNPLTREITSGMIPNLFGFRVFPTTLLPTATEVECLFLHQSSVMVKMANALPRVKVIASDRSIGDRLQIFQRFGRVVADANRVWRKGITV